MSEVRGTTVRSGFWVAQKSLNKRKNAARRRAGRADVLEGWGSR